MGGQVEGKEVCALLDDDVGGGGGGHGARARGYKFRKVVAASPPVYAAASMPLPPLCRCRRYAAAALPPGVAPPKRAHPSF